MKNGLRFFTLLLLVSLSFLGFSTAPMSDTTQLVAALPAGWTISHTEQNQHMRVIVYSPAGSNPNTPHEKLFMANVRKTADPQFFGQYHSSKIQSLKSKGCQITPSINEAFTFNHTHYEYLTFECPSAHFSGVNVVYNADDSNIYDISYFFPSPRLSPEDAQKANNMLKKVYICKLSDTNCLNKS